MTTGHSGDLTRSSYPPTEIPRTAIIDQSGRYAVIYLGSLGEMLRRASVMAVTARPS